MKPVYIVVFFIYLGFIAYSMVLFVSGEAGLRVLKERITYRDRLLQNIDELNDLHIDLNRELSVMRTSKEKNRLLARSLGYYSKDEYPVYSKIFKRHSSPLKIGRILNPAKPVIFVKNNSIALTVSIFLCIGALAMFVFKQRSK